MKHCPECMSVRPEDLDDLDGITRCCFADVAVDPRYEEIEVQLTGQDGNGFFIVARIRSALERARVDADDVELFFKDALSGNYGHLLAVAQAWVSVR